MAENDCNVTRSRNRAFDRANGQLHVNAFFDGCLISGRSVRVAQWSHSRKHESTAVLLPRGGLAAVRPVADRVSGRTWQTAMHLYSN